MLPIWRSAGWLRSEIVAGKLSAFDIPRSVIRSGLKPFLRGEKERRPTLADRPSHLEVSTPFVDY